MEVSEEDFGQGGMRIASKATVLEGLSHDLLRTFSKGTDVLLKRFNDTVVNAAEEKNRSIKSIAKKVNLSMFIIRIGMKCLRADKAC
jgi:hypothetical protein